MKSRIVLYVPNSPCPIWLHTGERYLALTRREAQSIFKSLQRALDKHQARRKSPQQPRRKET